MIQSKGMKIFAAAAILTASLLMVSAPDAVFASAETRGGPRGQGNGPAMMAGQGNGALAYAQTGAALTPLSAEEAEALQEAILEEYGAYNLYSSIIAQFGSTIPFSQIVRSEQQHINALLNQANKYGLSVPENPGLTSAPQFASLTEACQAGVDAEIADAALYDTFTPVTTHADLLAVYERLQSASLNSHLPAFEACN